MSKSLCMAAVLSACASLCAAGDWRAVGLDRVKVGGELGRRIAVTVNNNLHKIDAEEFLAPFREKTLGYNYTALGKLIDATVLLAKHTGDPELLALKRRLVGELVSSQLADGYIGAMAENAPRLWAAWDAHEIAYIVKALVCDWEEFGETASLEAAKRAADYVLANWKTMPDDWGRTWCNIPMYTIGQCNAFIRLYLATGERRYLDFCLNERALRYFDTPVFQGRDMMVWGHMYTYFDQCLAQMRLYALARDESLLAQVRKGVDFILDRDGGLVTGCSGVAECWTDSQDGDGDVGETCATVYQLFCYDALLRNGGEDAAKMGDVMERTVYNGLFAAQSPDGRKIRYYTPLLGEREYFDRDTYCCPNNYRRAIARMPQWLVYEGDDALLFNLYSECEATAQVGGTSVDISEKTAYPADGEISISISPESPKAFAVFLRIPEWCDDPGVWLNGVKLPLDCREGRGLFRVTATWKRGDEIKLSFPMRVRIVRGRRRQSGRFAVLRGPVVYAWNPKATEGEFFRRHPFDIQKVAMMDPNRLSYADGGIEAFVSTEPFAVGVGPFSGETKIVLTPFADPDDTITYFKAPNLEHDVTGEDEIFGSCGE